MRDNSYSHKIDIQPTALTTALTECKRDTSLPE